MKKCKVLLVVNSMNMGGLENFVMNVVRNIDLSKFYIEFLYCNNIESYFDEEISDLGFKISRITSRSKCLYKHLKELNIFFQNNRFDVVHINYDNATCFTVAKAAKKSGVKKIIVHSHNSNSIHKIVHHILKPLVSHYANIYFACSELAANWMYTKKINQSGKVTIIKNAINTEQYIFSNENRETLRRELGLENEFIIGHIGRFNYQKNHKFLIDVFEEFHKMFHNSKLLLLGSGELLDEIKNYAQQKNLTEHVIFAGIRNDVNKILSVMDCFVFPSYFEGLPVTLVEVQAAGLSSIISDRVTNEVKVTDLVEYMSLESSAEEWAKQIADNTKQPTDRKKYFNMVKQSGFDIKEEVRIIESIYSE